MVTIRGQGLNLRYAVPSTGICITRMLGENAVSHKDCEGIALQAPTCGCSLVGNEGLVIVVYGSLNYEGWAFLQNFDSC